MYEDFGEERRKPFKKNHSIGTPNTARCTTSIGCRYWTLEEN